jgi:putative Mg2+ transporter-C (MgtC) family protein
MAASIAMIQMNLLLPTNGKPHDSYAVMDLMRLPLGILTGVGFIGAGAIIKKDDMVIGVTTAATLWFSTVVGLCLGGGQLIFGSVSAVLGYLALTALRFLERRIEEYQPATLVLVTTEFAVAPAQLKTRLEAARFRIKSLSVDYSPAHQRHSIRCEVRWPSPKRSRRPAPDPQRTRAHPRPSPSFLASHRSRRKLGAELPKTTSVWMPGKYEQYHSG